VGLRINYHALQFANEDNSDSVTGEYLLVNLKAEYKIPLKDEMMLKLSAGIDNVLNEDYYDYHPYPQRTFFTSISLDM